MTTRIRLPRLLKKRRKNRVLAAERQGFSIMTTRIRLPRLLEKQRQGFSIIELMVAIFIIALMALAGFTVFKGFRERTSVKVAARDVVNIMRLARQKAVTNRVDYYALYDTTNKTVWVQPKSSYPPKNPDQGTEHSLPDRVVIDNVTSGGSDTHKHHTFTPKSTSTSGGVYLCDEEEKIKYSVRLVSATARAKIYDSWE